MKVKEILKDEGLINNICNEYCGQCIVCPLALLIKSNNCFKTLFLTELFSKGYLSNDFLESNIDLGKFEPKILNDIEKRYLEGVLKPFKDSVEYIIKEKIVYNQDYCFIKVGFYGDDDMTFPTFATDSMYRGMEVGVHYTLEELGLFEGDSNDR